MSVRDENRVWLERQLERDVDPWAARAVKEFGMEGLLDALEAAEGRPSTVNLTRRPFAGNERLKSLVRDARTAEYELTRAVCEVIWDV